ncbi:hypothetical protein [Streptococcus sp. DD13]|uniref:hypothetical protein n=1 Tax=Streptococcus sp. DD13 TaxID=1777881 RepID=UPI00079C35F8|nr:hypothetical protein [Streptococcus sp. DD13]KXT77665.1 hypothetical protein STRDD13_01345 [Streptococcus sp. DD13]
MIDKRLKSSSIPASVILNNFVTNEPESNYEYFLLDFLNHSKYFQEKTNHQTYQKPLTESNSECDAINSRYSIDFKLLATNTYLRGLRLTSISVSRISDGFITYGVPKRPNEDFLVTEIHKVFRPLSLKDMTSIRHKRNIIKLSLEDDIYNVLTTMETNKNLLLFFPYKFHIDENIELSQMTKIIREALENDFHNLSIYREQHAYKFETFLMTVYKNYFLLFSFKKSEFDLLEVFDTQKSHRYIKLTDYSNPFKRFNDN